jgi:hypothetical protein
MRSSHQVDPDRWASCLMRMAKFLPSLPAGKMTGYWVGRNHIDPLFERRAAARVIYLTEIKILLSGPRTPQTAAARPLEMA